MEGEKAYWDTLQKLFKIYALLGWIVCIPTVLFSHMAISVLYGDEYKDGAIVLCIYVFTNIAINMGVAQGLWLLNERKPIVNLMKTLIGAVIAIIGNWLVIPYWGLNGVAMVAVMAMLTSAIFSNYFFSKDILFLQIKSLFFVK